MNQVLALLRFFREQEWIKHATHANVRVLVDDASLLQFLRAAQRKPVIPGGGEAHGGDEHENPGSTELHAIATAAARTARTPPY